MNEAEPLSPSTAERAALPDLSARLRFEILEAMTRGGSLAAVFSVVLSLLVMRLMWHEAPLDSLLTWFGCAALAFVFRLSAYTLWFRRRHSANLDALAFERLFAASALAGGMIWAALPLFVIGKDPVLQSTIAIIATAITLGGFASYGLSRLVYPFYVVPIFLAQAYSFVVAPGPYGHMMLGIWTTVGIAAYAAHRSSIARFRRAFNEHWAQERVAAEQRTLLDTLTLGVLVTDNRLIVDCNQTFLTMFGYKREELLGQSTRILMNNEREYELAGERNRDLALGLSMQKQVERVRRDGTVFSLELNVGLVDPTNPSSLIVSTYEDISERLHTERELRVSRERLRLALDALQSGVWDVDLNEQRYFYSRRFKSILGLPVDEHFDAKSGRLHFHHEWVVADDAQALGDVRQAMLLYGEPYDIQYRLNRPTGEIWVRETAVARLGADGLPYRFTASITDTTAINLIQDRLRVSEEFHRGLIEASTNAIWRSDAHGLLTFINERGAADLYGYDAAEMIGRHMYKFLAPESLTAEALALFDPVLHGEAVNNIEAVQLTKSQRRIFVTINAAPMYDAHGQYAGVMGINSDITHLKKRERAFQDATRLQRLIFDGAGEGIVLVRNGRLYRVNQAFADLMESTIGELVTRPLADCFEDPAVWMGVEQQLVELGNVIRAELRVIRQKGPPIWVSVTGRVAEMAEQDPIYVWVLADISVRKEQEEQSWHRANHDDLTGLPNRRLLYDRLEQALAHSRRDATRLALLMFDLDGFKEVNDLYGHQFGDEVLMQIAARLSTHIRQLDTVARLGGDEFVLILNAVAGPQEIELMARRMIERVAEPVTVNGTTLRVSTSLGIAIFPENADGITGLMHAADMAMYAAKASGKNTYRVALPMLRSQRVQ